MKYLLTWYGITDFRASLGFENTNGPIAGALAAESYSDVVILGYTRADNDSAESIKIQKSFAAELAAIRDTRQEKDWKAISAFISKFSNTSVAHEHFIAWLKSEVRSVGSAARIHFKSEKLRELNDTEGIYACAMRALNWVEQGCGEKLVTLYLSPGTPVMAFVWAFAALGYPDLKKRLIASSIIGKPPEVISLPAQWLERHGAKQKVTREATNGFDVTFHLFGEQRMPSLLSIRQFESKSHVFVNSKEYSAACMRQFIRGKTFAELPVDPWDDHNVHEKIIHHAKNLPANTRIGVNLTGGTKLMFAGALSAARVLGAVPFYFDSRNRRVTFVDGSHSETLKQIDSVDSFLLLNGDGLKLSNKGVIKSLSLDRQRMAETFWEHRDKIASCYVQLTKINNEHDELRRKNKELTPFKVESYDFVFEYSKNKSARVIGYGLNLSFENWADFAKYLLGGWFEEYVYLQCKPYEEAGIIKDLRINLKLSVDQQNAKWSEDYNELDVVFTDGYSLYIVECKAGKVTQEQVMKLQNLVRFYGGVEGRGVVACCFKSRSKSVQKKIDDARLVLCCEETFSEQLKKLMNNISERAQSTGMSK